MTPPSRQAHLLAALAIVFVTLVEFWPFVAQGRHSVPFHYQWGSITGIPDSGDPRAVSEGLPRSDDSPIFIHYPNACLSADSLRRGELPLWNPYQGCGTAALGGGQTYPFSPFQWVFFLFPNPWTFTLGLLLGSLWGAAGVYLWLGELELSPPARALGALLACYNPHGLAWVVYSSTWVLWWLGWLLWSWHLFLRADRRFGWLPAVMVSGMVYCGHPEVAFLFAGASCLYLAAVYAGTPRVQRVPLGRATVRLLGVAALACGLTAVHWAPVLAHYGESATYKGAFQETILNQRYPISTFLSPLSDLYMAPALLALVGAGAVALWRRRALWPSLALLAFALLMGHLLLPFRPVLTLVSANGLIRAVYWRPVIWCAVAALAASGAAALWSADEKGRLRRVLAVLAGAAPFGLFLLVEALLGNPVYRSVTALWLLLNGGVLAVLAWAAGLRKAALKGALLAAVCVAVVLDPYVHKGFSYPYFNRADPRDAPVVRDTAATLGRTHGRLAASLDRKYWVQAFLTPNMATVYRLRDIRIVDVLLPRRMVALHDGLYGADRGTFGTILNFPEVPPWVLGSLGVSVFGAPLDENSGRFRWSPVDALPRAFLVHRVVRSSGEEESAPLWRELAASGKLKETAILEGWPGGSAVGEGDAHDAVRWLEDSPRRIRLGVTCPKGGVLLLLDTYASGWRAAVGGRPAAIWPADLSFRGVEVPPGDHDVEFYYAPRAVFAGGAVTCAAWGTILFLLWAGRRRSRGPASGSEGKPGAERSAGEAHRGQT